MDRPPDHRKRLELREKRRELHGKRRNLHDRLSEVCEDFVVENLTTENKQKTLVRELQYLADYYKDNDTWKEVE